MAKQTQIDALLKQVQSGKLTSDKAKILSYIGKHPYTTDLDLVNHLGMHRKTASARLTDLEDMGLITTRGVQEQEGYSRNRYITVDNAALSRYLREQRDNDKYIKWLKKGLNDYDCKISYPLIELLNKHLMEVEPF